MATRVLSHPPTAAVLYAKAALPAIPGLSHLPLVGGLVGGARAVDTLPDLTLRLPAVRVEADHVTAYRRVCGFDSGSGVPGTYLHVLAFPLHLTLMTSPDFPFAPIGAVHISNRIEVHRPVQVADAVDLRVSAVDLQPHPRGRQATLVSEARIDDELVWRDETVVLSCGRGGGDSAEFPKRPDVPDEAPTGPVQWRLPGNLGRRYAAISGDRNPIHLYDVTARAFGFSRHIAHGMWTKARCLAELSNRLPGSYAIEVAFKKPVYLPSSVSFGARHFDGTVDFGVAAADASTAHLLGRIQPL